MEVKKYINNKPATEKRWPRPHNRGIKYSSLLTNKSGLRKVASVMEGGRLIGGRLIEVGLYLK